jgi:hypothetical protein
MRAITSLPNTTSPDADFPYGRFKDTVGANPGTRVNESMAGDWAQFFAKIMDEAGITPNGLPDSEYSGWQLYEALKGVFGGTRKKVIPIGTWNMDTTASVAVAHGVTLANIRSVSFVIIDDAGTFVTNGLNPVSFATDASLLADATNITLARRSGGVYDDAAYDGSGNRGYIVIDYVE